MATTFRTHASLLLHPGGRVDKPDKVSGEEVPRGRLKFLCEYESDINYSLSSLFVRLTDDTNLCHCSILYGITEGYQDDHYKGFSDELNNFIHDKGIEVRLEQAPLAENPGNRHRARNKLERKEVIGLPRRIVAPPAAQGFETRGRQGSARTAQCGQRLEVCRLWL